MRPDFEITVLEQDGRHTVAIRGELDMAYSDQVLATLIGLCDEGAQAITLDLRQLDFMDSFGLRALLAGRAYCREHHVRFSILDRMKDQLRRLFDIAGVGFELRLGADDHATLDPPDR